MPGPNTLVGKDGKPLFTAPTMWGLKPVPADFEPEGCDDPWRPGEGRARVAMPSHRAGDRVVSSTGQRAFDGPGVVQSVGPKNTRVLLDGHARAVRIPHHMLTAGSPPVVAAPGGLTRVPVPAAPVAFTIGQLVRWGARDAASRPGLYVVIGFGTRNGRETTKVAVLGGDRNKYWAAVGNVLVDANGELPRS